MELGVSSPYQGLSNGFCDGTVYYSHRDGKRCPSLVFKAGPAHALWSQDYNATRVVPSCNGSLIMRVTTHRDTVRSIWVTPLDDYDLAGDVEAGEFIARIFRIVQQVSAVDDLSIYISAGGIAGGHPVCSYSIRPS